MSSVVLELPTLVIIDKAVKVLLGKYFLYLQEPALLSPSIFDIFFVIDALLYFVLRQSYSTSFNYSFRSVIIVFVIWISLLDEQEAKTNSIINDENKSVLFILFNNMISVVYLGWNQTSIANVLYYQLIPEGICISLLFISKVSQYLIPEILKFCY